MALPIRIVFFGGSIDDVMLGELETTLGSEEVNYKESHGDESGSYRLFGWLKYSDCLHIKP